MMVMGVNGGHVTELFSLRAYPHKHPLSSPPTPVISPRLGRTRTRARHKKTGFHPGLNRPIRKRKYFNKPRPQVMLSTVLKMGGSDPQPAVIGCLLTND